MNIQTAEPKQISSPKTQTMDADAIQVWLQEYLSQLLDVELTEIDIKYSFESYGLDSSSTIALTGDLEDWLGFELDPTLLYEYSTIEQLVSHLVQELSARS